MGLRKHQAEFEHVMEEKINGGNFHVVLLRATPGAGKSTIPVQATKMIRAGLADRIAWIVPRDSLRAQGEKNFQDPFFRKMFNHKYSIRAAGNETDPCRGTHGLVTTYQAVGVDSRGHLYREFKKHRYILILDEFHHCELEGLWTERLQDLVENAIMLILMTGTLQRGDGKPIAFLPYKKEINAGVVEYKPHLSAPSMRYIEYTRADALKEQAIIPMQFCFHDGSAEYEKDMRRTCVDSIASATPKQASAALYTALRTDYASELLQKAVTHWMGWRKKIKTSKFLVVCADHKTARQALQQVRKITNRPADIATSHESAAAARAIERFKRGELEILISIAMAYEGLDVPSVSHIACLTHIRSMPWIEQMIARAVRIDPAYRYLGQIAHIYAPDDPLMRKIVDKVEHEQLSTIDNYGPGGEKEDPEQLTLFSATEPGGAKTSRVNPIGSRMTGEREWVYGDPVPVENVQPAPAPAQPSPKEQELADRKEIENHIRKYCRLNRVRQQTVNAEVKAHFGKGRAQMTRAELGIVKRYVKQNYPTHYQRRGRRPPVDTSVKVEHFPPKRRAV